MVTEVLQIVLPLILSSGAGALFYKLLGGDIDRRLKMRGAKRAGYDKHQLLALYGQLVADKQSLLPSMKPKEQRKSKESRKPHKKRGKPK